MIFFDEMFSFFSIFFFGREIDASHYFYTQIMHANAYECMAVESPSKSYTHTKKSTVKTKIASFNVRGLTDPIKQQNLVKDLVKYNIGICCLQETKVSDISDEMVGGFRVILLPRKCRHYGLGFALN
jgi:hypothetical protein